jgi:ribose-phosphate pyrophosphokinase
VSPDLGRAKPAARFAGAMKLEVAAAQKERLSDDRVEIGQGIERLVKGYRKAIIYDDEIATGATVLELSRALVAKGIEDIRVVCTHGVFAHEALPRLAAFPEISEIITTDTVAIPHHKRIDKLTILSVASVFGEAIWKNYNRESIGDLFSFS